MDAELEGFLKELSAKYGIPADDIVVEALGLWLERHPENRIEAEKRFRAAMADPRCQEIIEYFSRPLSGSHT